MDNSDKGPSGARDGHIDFGGYTTEQLVELESSIDPERFPLNHARLVEELERRENQQAPDAPPQDRWDIRFSRSESFWSWVQAKRHRQWFYGPGYLEIQPGEILLGGWQRTWLGVPVQGERRIAPESIRNVGRDDATVMINVAGWPGSGRKVEFDCDSPESASSLCERLPPVRDSAFEREWQEMRALNRTLCAPRNYPWGATALVLINVLVFLVFSIATKSWLGVLPQVLTVWGSNFGPLTVGGQWWRLLSSLFLHSGFLHLVLNMWVLWNVGRLAERLFGHSVFLLLYFFTGVVAGLATVVWNPALNVLGSSGAIFGLMGAVLASVIRPSHRTPTGFVRSHWLSLLLFTLFNLVSGFMQFGIANAAHVGGLASGALLGAFIAFLMRGDLERRYRLGQVAAALGAAVIMLLIALAWTARGHGYATSVTSQEMEMFEYRIAMAEGVLEDIQSRSKDEPLWYTLRTSVKLDLGETRGEIKNVFDDGISRFPEFLPLYRAVLRAFMPRWGGSYEKVNELIDDAALRGDSKAGAQMYARLYWVYASLEGDDVDIFTDGRASWPRMSEGFDLMLKQYPDSDYLMNGYAYMACRSGDSGRYHALNARLKYRLSSTAWSPRYSPQECEKKYAGNGT